MEDSSVAFNVSRPCARRERGTSLVELAVSLALGALMLTMMAGSVLALALGEQNGTAAASLASTIESARAEAALRRISVGVCGIAARDSDAPTTNLRCTDGAWTGGWITFADVNGNLRFDDGEALLHVQRTRRVHVDVTPSSSSDVVSFRPVGTLAYPVALRLAVQAANTNDPNARAVCVGSDGYVQVVGAQTACH
jgi:Tfp pilus assembly protein FimT